MKIYSWNVNGIRAISKKEDFNNFFTTYQPDILCLQETKAQEDQLDSTITEISGYKSYFISAEKKGYSGVALYTKHEVISINKSGHDQFDSEGRYMEVEFADFVLINCYFPNSQALGKRLDYKIAFNKMISERIKELTNESKKVYLCGDFNVAHEEIDLKNPKTNTKNPGFLPEERAWMSSFLDEENYDTFRLINGDKVKYSWWSYRMNAREKNIGWRIDYFTANKHAKESIIQADILNDVYGSDHCPVYIEVGVK